MPTVKSLDELVLDASETTSLSRDTITNWVTTPDPGEYDVVARYWIETPFIFAELHHHPDFDEYKYHLHTPDFSDSVRDTTTALQDTLTITDSELRTTPYDTLTTLFQSLSTVTDSVAELSTPDAYKAAYMLKHTTHPLQHIRGMVADPHISSVDCSGKDAVIRVTHRDHGSMMTTTTLSERGVKHVIRRVRHSVDGAVDGTYVMELDDQTVFTAGDEDTSDTPSFSIRTYDRGNVSPIELIQSGMFSVEAMAYLWEVVSYGVNIAVTGGTNTGKSLTLNALGDFIPENNRVITVEDRREIELPHPHWMPMTTTTDTTMSDVVEDAIRSRPQYIFLDDVRGGDEAGALFQAASTGHVIMFVMHATSTEELVTRLATAPLSVPDTYISTLDVVVNVSRHTVNGDSVNRCCDVSELGSDWNGSPETLSINPVSTWDATSDSHKYALQDSRVLDQIAELELISTDVISDRIETRRAILTALVERDCTDTTVLSEVVNEFETSPETRPVTTGEDGDVTEWITKRINNAAGNT